MWYRLDGENLILTLHIQPGARNTEVAGLHGDALKIRLAAPPVEGRANLALVAYLAERFGVPARCVTLKQGESSRRKIVCVSGSKIPPDAILP